MNEQNAKFENYLCENHLSHETDIVKIINALLTSLLLVAPSSFSTRRDTTEGVLTLLISPLCLAQCMRIKEGEPLRDDASSYDEDDSLTCLEELAIV